MSSVYSFSTLIFAAVGICLVASYYDLKKRIILDSLTKPAIVVGLICYPLIGAITKNFYLAISSFIGAATGFGIGLVFVQVIGWEQTSEVQITKENIRGGDVKLLTALGALMPFHVPFLGLDGKVIVPYPAVISMFVNSIIITIPLFLIFRIINPGKKMTIPYAPSLTMGLIITILWGDLLFAMITAFIG